MKSNFKLGKDNEYIPSSLVTAKASLFGISPKKAGITFTSVFPTAKSKSKYDSKTKTTIKVYTGICQAKAKTHENDLDIVKASGYQVINSDTDTIIRACTFTQSFIGTIRQYVEVVIEQSEIKNVIIHGRQLNIEHVEKFVSPSLCLEGKLKLLSTLKACKGYNESR